jgi:hypothetical protein
LGIKEFEYWFHLILLFVIFVFYFYLEKQWVIEYTVTLCHCASIILYLHKKGILDHFSFSFLLLFIIIILSYSYSHIFSPKSQFILSYSLLFSHFSHSFNSLQSYHYVLFQFCHSFILSFSVSVLSFFISFLYLLVYLSLSYLISSLSVSLISCLCLISCPHLLNISLVLFNLNLLIVLQYNQYFISIISHS